MAVFVAAWRGVGPILEKERFERMERPGELRRFLDATDGILKMLNRDLPARDTSGLVEQQRLFSSLRG